MSTARHGGFTLIEVLVALALVAVVLGGTLGVVRESIASQQHLEQRMLAEWAASNVLDQYLLEHEQLVADSRAGKEILLGRTFSYVVTVRKLPPPLRRGLSKDPADPAAQAEAGASPATPPVRYAVVVEVRDGGRRATPLARLARERRGAAAG